MEKPMYRGVDQSMTRGFEYALPVVVGYVVLRRQQQLPVPDNVTDIPIQGQKISDEAVLPGAEALVVRVDVYVSGFNGLAEKGFGLQLG